MTDKQIRVLLIDDHTLFRKGLAELLEQRGEITVAGVTGNPDEAIRLLHDTQPDVVITDLNMLPVGGLALLRRIRAEDWRGPVLVLTVSDDEEDLANAMRAGAQGYLLKDMEPDDVVDAVQRAVRGETVVAPTMTMKLVRLLQGGAAVGEKTDALKQLTAREKEILELLSRGAAYKEIGNRLSLSIHTVRMHIRGIYGKLQVHSRGEAVAKYLRP